MQLPADELVELKVVGGTSDEAVRRAPEKNSVRPWLKERWCIPPGPSGAFVAAMEDAIAVYHREYDPRRPVVCIDARPVQLTGETRAPIPARPGQPERYDSEYKRNGTANLFVAFAPLVGWRRIEVTERRTAKDFGSFLRYVAGEVYGEAERVVLATDNLNVHGPEACTRRSTRRRPGGWPSGSSGTTRPSTGRGAAIAVKLATMTDPPTGSRATRRASLLRHAPRLSGVGQAWVEK